MSIFVIGHQRIILTGVLPIVTLYATLCNNWLSFSTPDYDIPYVQPWQIYFLPFKYKSSEYWHFLFQAVSQKDPPHNNFFFFNGTDGSGMVDCITKWSPWSSLVQIMAGCLIGTKPIPELMLNYGHWGFQEFKNCTSISRNMKMIWFIKVHLKIIFVKIQTSLLKSCKLISK